MFNTILVYSSTEKHLLFKVSRNSGIKAIDIVNNIFNHKICSHHTYYHENWRLEGKVRWYWRILWPFLELALAFGCKIAFIKNFCVNNADKLGEHFPNLSKRIQLKNIRPDKEYSLVYQCTSKVGPLTMAIEDKSHRCIFVSMLFLIWFFCFPTWCTDPAKIVKCQPEYIVGVQQNLTLNCEAEGNPPSTYTWVPCNDPEQVCDKNTLQISQVLNDTTYTCRVANMYGDDSKTANVCKSHEHCGHAFNSCTFIHVPTWHFDWVLRVEPGVSLSGCKSPNSAFTLSW